MKLITLQFQNNNIFRINKAFKYFKKRDILICIQMQINLINNA